MIRISSKISSQHSSHKVERQDDKKTDASDSHHGTKGDCTGSMVVDGYEVDEEGGSTYEGRQEECGE